MCVVKLDRSLDCSITNDVAVCEVLGNNPRPGLLLLCDLVRIPLGIGGVVISILGGRAGRRLDGDVG